MSTGAPSDNSDLGPLPSFFRPFVDAVARIPATVHRKLLAGFMVIAILLLSMGIVSVVVVERINGQVERLTALSDQVSTARLMVYEVTAQSHYRAMALLTDDDAYWTGKIYTAKSDFDANLQKIQTYAVTSLPGLLHEAF